MHLIQILLPLRDNNHKAFPSSALASVQKTLTKKFGGITAYERSPAKGAWEKGNKVSRDDIIIIEVMTKKANKAWWKMYKEELEKTFRQQELVIRAQKISLI